MMNTIRITLFCVASLLGCLGLAVLLYPEARLSEEILAANRAAQPMESFDLVIDAGDFGPVTVIELMAYYLENPPQPEVQGGAAQPPKRHFGGC